MGFRDERAIKATRKRHLCIACDKWIEAGEPAVNWVGTTDGDFNSAYYHPDCRQAEIAFNALRDSWGDEWDGLRDMDPEDFPWLKTEYPTVYLRTRMTREQWASRKEQSK